MRLLRELIQELIQMLEVQEQQQQQHTQSRQGRHRRAGMPLMRRRTCLGMHWIFLILGYFS